MKGYVPSKGWLVQCRGGPNQGHWLRLGWNQEALDTEVPIEGHPEGIYKLRLTGRTVKYKGTEYLDYELVWEPW